MLFVWSSHGVVACYKPRSLLLPTGLQIFLVSAKPGHIQSSVISNSTKVHTFTMPSGTAKTKIGILGCGEETRRLFIPMLQQMPNIYQISYLYDASSFRECSTHGLIDSVNDDLTYLAAQFSINAASSWTRQLYRT